MRGFCRLFSVALVSILAISNHSSAAVPTESNQDWTYNGQDFISRARDQLLYDVGKVLGASGYFAVALGKPVAKRPLSISQVDAIFSTPGLHSAVFVKVGVKPSPGLSGGLLPLDSNFIFHGTTAEGTPFVLYFLGLDSKAVHEVISALPRQFALKDKLRQPISPVQFLGISEAFAADTPPCANPQLDQSPAGLHSIYQTLTLNPVIHGIASCAIGTMEGAWDSTGGLAIDGLKTAYNVVTAPIQSGKKFWEGVKQTWNFVSSFYHDFSGEFSLLYNGFSQLDPQIKTELACRVASMIGTATLVTYFTAGAGAPALRARISKILEELAHSPQFSAVLSKLKRLRVSAESGIDEWKMISAEMTISEGVERDLLTTSRVSVAQSKTENQEILDALKYIGKKEPALQSKRKVGITENEAKALFNKVYLNPVAAIWKADHYDPKDEGIGFCFGRAMTAHLDALRFGVQKENIRKIWAIGDLSAGGENWGWHVATLVKGTDQSWYAIDPIMGKPMKAEEWYESMKKYDHAGDMRIMVTDANRFGTKPFKYNPRLPKVEFYNGYFKDLLDEFKAGTDELVRRRRAAAAVGNQ